MESTASHRSSEALDALDRALSVGAAATAGALPKADDVTARMNDVMPAMTGENDELNAPTDGAAAERRDLLHQRVDPDVASAAIAAAVAPIVIALLVALPSLRSGPRVLIPPERLAEFREKAAMMASADTLCEEGKYEQGVAAYDAYLERYPNAPEALDAYAQMARAYRGLNSPEQVRATLKQARLLFNFRIPYSLLHPKEHK